MGLEISSTLFQSEIWNVVKLKVWFLILISFKYLGSLVIAFVMSSIERIAEVSPIEFNHVITDFNYWWNVLKPARFSFVIWGRSKTDFSFENDTTIGFPKLLFNVLIAVAWKRPFLPIESTVRLASPSNTHKSLSMWISSVKLRLYLYLFFHLEMFLYLF